MSEKYYRYGEQKVFLIPQKNAWLVSPTKVAEKGKALNRHQVDLDNIKLIVGANKEVAALFKDMEIDASYPERFLVVRGGSEKMKALIKKLKQENALNFHLRPCYRTEKDDFELFLTDDVLVRMKAVLVVPDDEEKDEEKYKRYIDEYTEKFIKPLLNALFKELQWDSNNYRVLRVEKDRETEGPLVLFRVLETDPEDAPLTAAKMLGDEKFKEQVVYASPNFLFQARSARQLSSPLGKYDPRKAFFYREEWHLEKLAAWDAWNAIADHFRKTLLPRRILPEIRVVVIDTGVDKDHPDLEANLILPDASDQSIWNFDYGTSDPSCDKGPGTYFEAAHGTACAGLIAAQGHLVGIAPKCKIVPLRCSTAIMPFEYIEAFRKAKDLGGHIISYSRMPSSDYLFEKFLLEQITEKIPVFCCAGNTGGQVAYPASIEAAIGVGASSPVDTRAEYSCWGEELDLLAPGGDWYLQNSQLTCKNDGKVVTTDICGSEGYNADPALLGTVQLNNYVWTCGTSFATPLAAGVAALMLFVNKNLSPAKILEILCLTAEKIEPAKANYQMSNAQGQPYPYGSFSQTHGYGRINAAAAIKEVIRRLRRFPP